MLETRIQLLKTAFVVYYHADLGKAKQFLLDFGMEFTLERPGEEIFFKGYGTEPYVYVSRKGPQQSVFGGAAYVFESRDELEKAHKSFGAKELRRQCSAEAGQCPRRRGTSDPDRSHGTFRAPGLGMGIEGRGPAPEVAEADSQLRRRQAAERQVSTLPARAKPRPSLGPLRHHLHGGHLRHHVPLVYHHIDSNPI